MGSAVPSFISWMKAILIRLFVTALLLLSMVWSGLSVPITPQMKIVMDYLRDYEEMSDEDLQELLNIKKTRAYLLARQMSEEGLIEIVGRGSEKKYRLK